MEFQHLSSIEEKNWCARITRQLSLFFGFNYTADYLGVISSNMATWASENDFIKRFNLDDTLFCGYIRNTLSGTTVRLPYLENVATKGLGSQNYDNFQSTIYVEIPFREFIAANTFNESNIYFIGHLFKLSTGRKLSHEIH